MNCTGHTLYELCSLQSQTCYQTLQSEALKTCLYLSLLWLQGEINATKFFRKFEKRPLVFNSKTKRMYDQSNLATGILYLLQLFTFITGHPRECITDNKILKIYKLGIDTHNINLAAAATVNSSKSIYSSSTAVENQVEYKGSSVCRVIPPLIFT